MLTRLGRSIAFYPLTGCYVGAIAILMLVAADVVALDTGVLALTLLVVMMLMLAMYREMRIVHLLVNSQRDAMTERIDQLIAALVAAGVSVPPAGTVPSDDRRVNRGRAARGEASGD